MCGRVRLSNDYSEIKIRLRFDAEAAAPNLRASWNIPPTGDLLVATRSAEGKRISEIMRWGLIPWWAKTSRSAFDLQCARGHSDHAFDLRRRRSRRLELAGRVTLAGLALATCFRHCTLPVKRRVTCSGRARLLLTRAAECKRPQRKLRAPEISRPASSLNSRMPIPSEHATRCLQNWSQAGAPACQIAAPVRAGGG